MSEYYKCYTQIVEIYINPLILLICVVLDHFEEILSANVLEINTIGMFFPISYKFIVK